MNLSCGCNALIKAGGKATCPVSETVKENSDVPLAVELAKEMEIYYFPPPRPGNR